MNLLGTRSWLLGLIVPATLICSVAEAQSVAADRAAKLVSTCQAPSNAIVTREDKAIVLLDRVPADEKMRACIFKMQNEHYSETVVIISEAWIDQALAGRREADRKVALIPARVEKITRLLAAIRQRDTAAIEREGVLGQPYTVDQSPGKRTPETTTTFNAQSLRGFESCRSMAPRFGGMDRISVSWSCPREADVPFSISETIFQFNELEIIAVRTGLGTVAMPEPPKVRSEAD